MRLKALISSVLLGTACLAGIAPVAAQQPKVLNLAFVGRVTAPEGVAMTAFAEEIKAKTNGRIEIRLHPGGALGGALSR